MWLRTVGTTTLVLCVMSITAAQDAGAAGRGDEDPKNAGGEAAPASKIGLKVEQLDPEQLARSPELRKAAETAPVVSGVVENALPPTLCGTPREMLQGKTEWIGPAGLTRVKALYRNESSVITVRVLDPGGLPPDPQFAEELVPLGEQSEDMMGIRRGVLVGGQPGNLNVRPRGAGLDLFLLVGGRLRVLIQARGVEEAELLTALEDIDWAQLAAFVEAS